jgi:hypothetical protein
MPNKPFTKADTTNAYGRDIVVYRSIDAKLTVEQQCKSGPVFLI